MKFRLLLTVALAAASAIARPAAADDYAFDDKAGHSQVYFGIDHLQLSYTFGRFNENKGTYTLDADPAKCKFQISINAASIDTGNEGRDNHLKSPDFFNVGEFPLITFESTKVAVKQDGEKTVYDVTGNMTMHGVTKEITLPMVKLGEKSTGRDYRSGFLCETTLKRSEFGISNGITNVGDDVEIKISFEGIRK
jgi:polyisoprenoid-binding protein YceI